MSAGVEETWLVGERSPWGPAGCIPPCPCRDTRAQPDPRPVQHVPSMMCFLESPLSVSALERKNEYAAVRDLRC